MSLFRGNNGPRFKHVADASAPYDAITVAKLTPVIGAEIGGVDLSAPLGNRAMEEIHRAFKNVARATYANAMRLRDPAQLQKIRDILERAATEIEAASKPGTNV